MDGRTSLCKDGLNVWLLTVDLGAGPLRPSILIGGADCVPSYRGELRDRRRRGCNDRVSKLSVK